jgi:tRNA (guanosine-2'-O-)-methyltransferase
MRLDWIVVAASLPILACGSSPSGGAVEPDDDLHVLPLPPGEPAARPAEGAVAMSPSCTPDTDERCDAVDQDCDGMIDEGCGYEPGALQVTVAWNTDANVDLLVTDPAGATLAPSTPSVPSGGALDRQAEGACGDPARDRIENARWPDAPQPGVYRVALQHVSPCDGPAVDTTATVAIRAGGRVLGVYNTVVRPGVQTAVAEIELP